MADLPGGMTRVRGFCERLASLPAYARDWQDGFWVIRRYLFVEAGLKSSEVFEISIYLKILIFQGEWREPAKLLRYFHPSLLRRDGFGRAEKC